MEPKNDSDPALKPGFSITDFVERMADSFIDIVAEIRHLKSYAEKMPLREYAEHLLFIKQELLEVVAYLVEDADFIDESYHFQDLVLERLRNFVGEVDPVADDERYLEALLGSDAHDIARVLSGAYSVFVEQCAATLSTIQLRTKAGDDTGYTISDIEMINVRLQLRDAQELVSTYVDNPARRLECLVKGAPVFYPRFPLATTPEWQLNYDHLTIFTFALMHELEQGTPLRDIEIYLGREWEFSLRTALVALYTDIPKISYFLDEAMFENSRNPYSDEPFTDRVDAWAAHHRVSNRPMARHMRDMDVDSVERIFNSDIASRSHMEPQYGHHPFSPYIHVEYDGDDGDFVEVTFTGQREYHPGRSNVPLNSLTAQYLDSPYGLHLTISKN